MPISAISPWQEAYCCFKSQNWFPAGNVEKLSAHKCEWAFCYQFFAVGALWIGMSQIFLLKPLKPVFCKFKQQVLFKFKNKIK